MRLIIINLQKIFCALSLILLIGNVVVEAQNQRVAVFDFRVTSGMSEQAATTLTNQFRSELNKTERFTLVERSAMNQLMSEQRFSSSDLADPDQAVALGRLLAANKVVVGDIGQVGRTYSVFVRLIDVESSTIEASESLRYQGELDGLFKEFEILAQKLAGTYIPPKKRRWIYFVTAGILGSAAAGYYLYFDQNSAVSGLPLPPAPPVN